jgi:hypothetical protein
MLGLVHRLLEGIHVGAVSVLAGAPVTLESGNPLGWVLTLE